MANFQPSYNSALGSSIVNQILAGGPYETKSITLLDNNSAAGEYTVGRLLYRDAAGKYSPLSSTETQVTNEAALTMSDSSYTYTDSGSQTVVVKPKTYTFTLAKPPIPGTLTIATNDTSPLALGTDDKEGHGKGAAGGFEVDYNSGRVTVTFDSTVVANTKIIQATYKHRAPSGATLGLPVAVLMEDISDAAIIASDVVTIAYFQGSFNASLLKGYSAGYESHLRRQGIVLVPSSVV